MSNPHALTCICGKRFRSYSAEAVHRHNFPALCKQSRRAKNAVKEQLENSPFKNLSLKQIVGDP